MRFGIISASYKEANICPVPKKGGLSVSSNHRPISLFNSESKVSEKKTFFKHLYNHIQEKSMLSSFQSRFIPEDSTISQLIYMYHTFCEAQDSEKEVRAFSCDISKAFDRVWPHGSILGPLLFLLFINDIVNGINSNIRLFADDTSVFIIVEMLLMQLLA